MHFSFHYRYDKEWYLLCALVFLYLSYMFDLHKVILRITLQKVITFITLTFFLSLPVIWAVLRIYFLFIVHIFIPYDSLYRLTFNRYITYDFKKLDVIITSITIAPIVQSNNSREVFVCCWYSFQKLPIVKN